MSKKAIIAVLLLGSLSAAGYVAWQQHNQPQLEQQYRLQAVEKGNLKQNVSANGTINPVAVVNVGTQVSGTVRKLYVDYNAQVKQGQVLLELDDALIQAQYQQTQANVKSAEAALELANSNEARSRALFAKEYVSKQELDTVINARKQAEAQLQQARAALQKDKVNMGHAVIRSPVSGVVVDRAVDVGQTVAASLQTPTLFKIARDLSKMQIDAFFAEADIGNIKADLPVKFTVDAFPNRHFRGKIRMVRINPTTQQNVVSYAVVLDVDNSEQLLLPGMTAYVTITVAERDDALLVPNAALRFKPNAGEKKDGAKEERRGKGEKRPDGEKKPAFPGKVYVLRNGQLTPISLSLGITDNRVTEVLEGELKPGDQVVVGDNKAPEKPKTDSARPVRMF